MPRSTTKTKEPANDLEKIEKLGYDAGKNGADLTNCDFRLFQTEEFASAWERGNERAKDEMRLISALGAAPTKPRKKK